MTFTRTKNWASWVALLTFLHSNIALAAINVSWPPIGGSSYSVPQAGETGWSNLTNYLVALAGAQGTTSQKVAIRTATTSPVTVASATDAIVVTNLSVAGAVAVNLPVGVSGQYFAIVDGKGDAATNNITVTPNGAETINGAASYVINKNRAAIILAFTGTNWSVYGEFNSFSSGGSVLINPMDSAGDMIYGGAAGVATKLDSGSANQILQSNGAAAPSWISTLTAAQGGTGQSSYTAGDILYASGATTLSKLAAGTSGQVLQTGATPSWVGTLLMADGTNAAPSHSFVNDSNSGLYSSGADSVSIATNGTARVTVTTASTSSTLPIRSSDGSTSSASFGWTSDADTGLYRKGTGNVGILSDGTEIASYSTAGQWTYGIQGSSSASLSYRYYVPTAASTTPSAVNTSPYLEFTSQCANGCPGLLGNNNTTSADAGLFLIGATKDGNTSGDMRFDVRENDNSAFSTTTNIGFRWSTFGSNLMTLLRNGTLAVDTDVLYVDSVNNTVGVGTSAPSTNAKLVVVSSGSITAPSAAANEALFVDTGASGSGITVLTANNQVGSLFFGDPDDSDIGGIRYDHTADSLILRANNASGATMNSAGRMASGNSKVIVSRSTDQSIGATTTAQFEMATEAVDTNSEYNTGTYRFTPTKTGYYYVSVTVRAENLNPASTYDVEIRKTGSSVASRRSTAANPTAGSTNTYTAVSGLYSLTASTDYIEVFISNNSASSEPFQGEMTIHEIL